MSDETSAPDVLWSPTPESARATRIADFADWVTHRRGARVVVGPKPVQGGDAPTVAGQQAGKPVLGNRRQQVVADGTLVF